MTIPNRNLNYPTFIKYGAGRIKELADHCRAAGMRRPLLVTDPALAKMPMIEAIVEDLKAKGMPVRVFSDLRPNPTEANVAAGVKEFKAGMHDGVIAIGGGSGLDVGKMVALMNGQTISMFDLEDIGDWWMRADASKIAPIVAVPTTAGTGSEVGRAGVITHPQTHEKKIIFHPAIMPKVAILDPELTVGLPAKLTAATGMDALAHCIESYCTTAYHPLAKGVALEGIKLIKENLLKAVKKPGDLDARGNMLVASAMGATAFQRGMGAVHALAHPFGGLYDAHHGLLNGILLPYVVKANRKAIEKDIVAAAAYLGIKGGFNGFIRWLVKLRKDTGIPHSLKAIGIDDKRLDEVVKMAMVDPNAGGNPIQFTAKQYKALAKAAIDGKL